jgi:8-oxo-dGTP pyrophosphatase MutT (NUDIX family)
MNPTPPRDASTVIVVRPTLESPGEGRVFMARRSSKSRFMPDAYVFPGGAVDPGDGPAGTHDAFLCAARRECREEAGLDLEGRDLHWVDTWLTPSFEKRRFFARFYVAEIGAEEGEEARADEREVHEGRWATPAEFLEAWERSEIDLAPPTLCALLRLREAGWRAMTGFDDEELIQPILPKWTVLESRHYIVLPHHENYAGLPGEAGPRPRRVDAMPGQFIREEKRWVPCD